MGESAKQKINSKIGDFYAKEYDSILPHGNTGIPALLCVPYPAYAHGGILQLHQLEWSNQAFQNGRL
ncbi:hypothetical protein D3C85_1402030 [compost metagenome]